MGCFLNVQNLNRETIENRIHTIQKIYLVLLFIGVVAILFKIVNFQKNEIRELGETVVQFVILGTIYAGLKIKGKWVFPLVLISSAFGAFVGFCTLFSPAYDFETLTEKIGGTIFLLFYVYQLS